jgi:hypothetical protein
MALIVAPAEGFDSYASLVQANAYFDAIGKTDWAPLSDTVKEQNLRRGSQFIAARRLLAIAIEPTVHTNVIAATCEAAYRAWKNLLYADVPAQAVKSVTVGPIKREMSDPVNGGQLKIPIIDDLLYGLTLTAGGYGPVVLERG